MSAVEELGDNCFSLATNLITELCEAFEEKIERKPTIDELCEILSWGIRSRAAGVLNGSESGNLVALTPKVTRSFKVGLKSGDVIAVPAGQGYCYLNVYLGRFLIHGDAMGILAGRHTCRVLAGDIRPVPIARPIFFQKSGVTSGRWPVVGHRPDWLALFPATPEYYYVSHNERDHERLGPYGSAEPAAEFNSPAGENGPLRKLTAEEAQAIGLLDPDFFQSGSVEEVEAYLARLLDADGAESHATGSHVRRR